MLHDAGNQAIDGARGTVDAGEGCGNGLQEFGEACDDGGETARCNEDCSLSECGDGRLNRTAGETCDDDNTQPGDGCDADCQLECGNGRLDPGEPCDEGAVSTATCDLDCSLPQCGDGTFNPFAFNTGTDEPDDRELCDTAGNASDCDFDCTLPTCNDGIFNAEAEDCDSFGLNATGCDFDCTIPSCGDDNLNAAAGEQCETLADTVTCDADCTAPRCGDGFYNTAFFGDNPQAPMAGCDGGGNTADCNRNCTLVADGNACGDEHVNPALGELCDAGGSALACDSDCTLPRCGDRLVNAQFTEACDSGGVNGGACNYDCRTPLCGDGVLNLVDPPSNLNPPGTEPLVLEQCDDGNNSQNDGCSSTCQIEVCENSADTTCCGDGILGRFEQCDDDDSDDADVCRNNCTFGPTVNLGNGAREGQECEPALDGACDPDNTGRVCGDGFVSPNEQCDDGNRSNGDGCSSTCQFEASTCGDGTKERYEQCDDGNRINGDGCSANCRNECGNATRTGSEQCDDGNRNNGDSCSADCRFEICGNGRVDSPAEPCDPTAPGGSPATCDPDCSAPACGDNIVNGLAGEVCDDGNTTSNDGCSSDCRQAELR